MGPAIGVPLTTIEPRTSAVVIGIFWHEPLAETAKRITVPVEFALQRDDEHIPRQSGLALFNAFTSKEKTLHANAAHTRSCPGSRPTARPGSSPDSAPGPHITGPT
ncbi:hypothetical protein [Streptomyces sp. NPDC088358]|uniref:hypothetical protein n=1 Tax=Streptomyces sp. NPDC088358 TaxID=3365857 RepID=UPI0037F681EC